MIRSPIWWARQLVPTIWWPKLLLWRSGDQW